MLTQWHGEENEENSNKKKWERERDGVVKKERDSVVKGERKTEIVNWVHSGMYLWREQLVVLNK